ncbi:tryptophan aminotransferase related 1 [Perilla frutescens var. hirtella]|uniref:Tryptophan aminotransferase related 1 n=1 Tax=Perilla frutescens var. hirtella TaxID=608512 RepID=A0AAD4J298_PERFH|nr:tryptophan aminotransferase related 1 [Perilla frutescens var. hirtella]
MLSTENAVVVKSSVTSSLKAASDVEAFKIESITNVQLQQIVNLDQGDPTMFEAFWKKVGEDLKTTIYGWQSLSYFANGKSCCWFMEPKLEQEIKILHNLVGNAVVEDRHVVVGNGSSQLIQAALYALAEPLNLPNPVSVVSATPFYSCYPQITDLVRSGLFKWEGNAYEYEKEGAYIELVTSPNNPDGEMRGPVVNRAKGMVIHDLAYYWPQYTPITSPADDDIMLFTVSKCTGHAGSRIGWALVKDEAVAKKMVKFIEINTIGVSKEAQLRAATILEMISHGTSSDINNFFQYSHSVMAQRWTKLRDALSLNNNHLLHVPRFPLHYCNFNRDFVQAHPAYAWLKCPPGINLEKILNEEKVRTRGGASFGCGPEYARVSMLGRGEDFDLFMMRLPKILELLASSN